MPYQHDAQLANIVTSYCTCLAGIMPMVFTLLTRAQPARWFAVYLCILITGIPTVWLHSVEGNRLASFADVGTNILLAWALQIAVSGDFMHRPSRRVLLSITTGFNVLVWGYLAWEVQAPKKVPFLSFGEFGQFYAGELALILNAFIVTGLFIRYHGRIERRARPILYLVICMFLIGMILASASNSHISPWIFPWHAAWHIVGAFGFMALWLFNHVRFNEAARTAEGSLT